MLGLLERSQDMYLDEIQEQLEEQHSVIISLATIYRTLHQLGITSKKV
jgi:Fe2+ or Zn2+ uptake regulation protein